MPSTYLNLLFSIDSDFSISKVNQLSKKREEVVIKPKDSLFY